MNKKPLLQLGLVSLLFIGALSFFIFSNKIGESFVAPVAYAKENVKVFLAQQYVTPTLYCLGGCPTASPTQPSNNQPTTPVAPTGTNQTPSTQPTGVGEPCENTASIARSGKRGHRHHKKSNGAIGGFMERLIELIKKLLELIMKLFGGGAPSQPNQPGQPNEPTEPVEPPSQQPCPPTEPAEPTQPPAGVPTTVPTVGSASVAPTVATSGTPVRSTSVIVPIRSGLAWASGAWGKNSASGAEAFGTWRGKPIDVAVFWPPRQSWSDITSASQYSGHTGKPYMISIGVPPFPEGIGGSLSACASGSYDSNWKTFGSSMKSTGLEKNAIIRLGWEFNGDWYQWKATNPAQFAECWKKVFTAVESVAPGLRWDWNVNRGNSQSAGANVLQAYPGDAYVDIVGVDAYDGHPPANNDSGWETQLNGAYGIKYWLDFAKQHNKKISFPEWGVTKGTSWAGNNGGDDANYIQKMHDFFAANASSIAYESYFDDNADYWQGSIYNPVQLPNASALYNQLW